VEKNAILKHEENQTPNQQTFLVQEFEWGVDVVSVRVGRILDLDSYPWVTQSGRRDV